MARKSEPATYYRVIAAFSPAGPVPRIFRPGDLVAGDDPVVKFLGDSIGTLMQPVDEFVAQNTNNPPEVRATQPTRKKETMPHVLPPEDEDSAASTFAPFQPTAGVASDDVFDKGQEAPGSKKASDAQEEFKEANKELREGARDEVDKPDSEKMTASGEAFDPRHTDALPQDEGDEAKQPRKSTAAKKS